MRLGVLFVSSRLLKSSLMSVKEVQSNGNKIWTTLSDSLRVYDVLFAVHVESTAVG